MDVGPYEALEIQDALVACGDLRAVIARLQRLGLLTDAALAGLIPVR